MQEKEIRKCAGSIDVKKPPPLITGRILLHAGYSICNENQIIIQFYTFIDPEYKTEHVLSKQYGSDKSYLIHDR